MNMNNFNLKPKVTKKMTLTYLAGNAKFLRNALQANPEMMVKDLYEDILKTLRDEGYDTNTVILD